MVVFQASGGMTDPVQPVPASKVPVVAIVWAGTVLSVILLVCLTILAWADKDSEAITRVVNTLLNFVGLLVGGGAFVFSRNAARNAEAATHNSAAAAVQTNGGLEQRIQAAVTAALDERAR